MVKVRILTGTLVIATVLLPFSAAPRVSRVVAEYTGLCDASAGAAISPTLFIVASDEDNRLRIYRRDTPGAPVQEFDLGAFLKVGPKQEADIEGAARIGDRIYWITSHGTDKAGEPRPNRRRLFAIDVKLADGRVIMTTVGAPYEDLLDGLTRLPGLEDNKPREASRAAHEQAKTLNRVPGPNIEGLSGTPQHTLLIAFRNPIPGGKAVVVPLNNPAQVVHGSKPEFGTPIALPLEGLGIRGIEYAEAIGSYLIIAGPPGEEGDFRLYRWQGPPSEAVSAIGGIDFNGLRPEALIVYPGERAGIQILSDDGTQQVDGRDCKRGEPSKRRFRSVWVPLRWRNDHLKTEPPGGSGRSNTRGPVDYGGVGQDDVYGMISPDEERPRMLSAQPFSPATK